MFVRPPPSLPTSRCLSPVRDTRRAWPRESRYRNREARCECTVLSVIRYSFGLQILNRVTGLRGSVPNGGSCAGKRRDRSGEDDTRDFVWDTLLQLETLGLHLEYVRTSESGACDSNSTRTPPVRNDLHWPRRRPRNNRRNLCLSMSAAQCGRRECFLCYRPRVIVIVAHSSAKPRNVRTRCVHILGTRERNGIRKRGVDTPRDLSDSYSFSTVSAMSDIDDRRFSIARKQS